MSLIDWVVFGVVLISVVIGVFRGLVREAFGLAGLVLSLWVAWAFGGWLAPHLGFVSDTPSVRLLAASLGLFIAVWVVCTLLTILIGRVVRGVGLAVIDRALGAGFGFARGLLICMAVVWLASSTPLKNDPWWSQSRTVPRLEWLASEVVKLLPARWQEKIQPGDPESETGKS